MRVECQAKNSGQPKKSLRHHKSPERRPETPSYAPGGFIDSRFSNGFLNSLHSQQDDDSPPDTFISNLEKDLSVMAKGSPADREISVKDGSHTSTQGVNGKLDRDRLSLDMGGSKSAQTGGEGPTGTPVDDALENVFGPGVRTLPRFTNDQGSAKKYGAKAFTEGRQVTLGESVTPDVTDPQSMAVIGEEVAHALAGGGSGQTELDQEGDPGEAKAQASGQAFADYVAGGKRVDLEPARGGLARIHRASDEDVSLPSVAEQENTLRSADQPHADVSGDLPEPRSARQLMKALRKGEGNVQISEEGRQGDEEWVYLPKSFDGSKKEILKVFRRLLKGSDSARELLEEAFGSGQEIVIKPQDDVIGNTASFEPDSDDGGVVGSNGKPGTPTGGSIFLDLDDLDSHTYTGIEGDTVSSTPETVLMHELAHAVHSARGVDNPIVGEYGNDPQEPREMSAISHENEARSDLGLPKRAAGYGPKW